MNLREWNFVEFLRSLLIGERTTRRATKVLGLLWDEVDDTISIGGIDKVNTQSVVTKRDVMHSVAKVFDPLGLLTPFTLLGKLFLQKLWRLNKCGSKPGAGGIFFLLWPFSVTCYLSLGFKVSSVPCT